MPAIARRSLFALGLATPALAQPAWPNRPVRVIVPWPPGGGADTVGRILFARVADRLGQTFVVENRPGATGMIGATAVARAEPDGYTLLHDATGLSVNPALQANMPFVAERDLAFIFLATLVPNLLVTNNATPQRTMAEVIALAKAKPGALDFASSGNGSAQHLALALFANQAGISVNHVPYRGGAQALADIIGGQVGFFFSNASASTGFVASGALRAIAHTGQGRLARFPDLPAVAETLPGYECLEWNGVLAPAGTPPPIIAQLNAVLNQVVREPEVATKFAGLSIETRPGTPEDFRRFYLAELTKWTQVVKAANITAD
jgi:tripartite-type tricarboxylate transporter receptor subunit TctC